MNRSYTPNNLFDSFHLFFLLFFAVLSFSAKDSPTLPGGSYIKQFPHKELTKLPPGKVVHIKDFGAVGNGITNTTAAFQKAASYLQANGGTLIIDPGIYIVGKQNLSGRYSAGSSYSPETILSIKNARLPIVIKGSGATIKASDGLKFGSFNPVTGDKDSIRKEGNRFSYYAAAFIFIDAVGCNSVSISGLTMDGNSSKLDIGPAFDSEGLQLMATGIRVYNNQQVNIDDCYIHHCALDAILVGWTGLKGSDPIYPHTIKNVKARYNGRQGLSWVGGNNLTVINSEFSSTGKALNKGMPVVSPPSAGIDIEIENSIIRNGNFINCLVYDNTGWGLSSIGHDTYNINFKRVTFVGTTNCAVHAKTQCFSFDSCVFVGKVERLAGSADKSKAALFKNCLFTMEQKKSPSGKVFGDRCEFYEGQNVIFDNCAFNAGTRLLPIFSNKEILFINCTFIQNNAGIFNASAYFKGVTRFVIKGKGKIDATEANFDGEVIYNNRRITDIKNVKFE